MIFFSVNFSQAGTNTGCSHNSWEKSLPGGEYIGVHFTENNSKYKWFFYVPGNQTKGCGEVSGTNAITRAYRQKGAEIKNRFCLYSFDPYKGNLKITQSGYRKCECAGVYNNLIFSACNTYKNNDKFEDVEDYYRENKQEGESRASPEDWIQAKEVTAVLTADFNADNALDKAVLVSAERLFLYLGVFQENEMKLALTKNISTLVPKSESGLKLSLETNNKGSLIIHSQSNLSASSTTEKITIAYRNKAFVVAGYNYDYDVVRGKTFDRQCEVNFLNRKGIANGKSFKLSTPVVKVSNWSHKSIPKQCQR